MEVLLPACTRRSMWSTQSCVPHRQPCAGGWLLVLSSPALLCRFLLWCAVFSWGRLFLWGRLSSLRPAFQPAWAPFTHCSQPNRVRPRWSEPPGFPPRPLRGARSLACHTGSPVPVVGFWSFPLLRSCAGFSCGARSSRGAGSFCGAGFLACGRLSSRPGCPLPTALNPTASAPGGASRPAFHPGLSVERAVLRATPAALCRWLAAKPFSVKPCGACLQACGRHSCRPGRPSPAARRQTAAARAAALDKPGMLLYRTVLPGG